MIPLAFTYDAEPDAAGFFDDLITDELSRRTIKWARSGCGPAEAQRFAFDEVCPGDWYEDFSDDAEKAA